MRIGHQSSTEIDRLGVYKQALLAHAAGVLGSNGSIDIHRIPAGRYRGRAPSDALDNVFCYRVVLEPFLANVVRAEQQG